MTTLQSSSGHLINGDRRLSRLHRVLWFMANWRNNLRATSKLDPALEIARFHAGNVAPIWSKIDALASPARRLCDLFWLTLPWHRIEQELGEGIRALEIGCGTGRYGLLLQECLDNGLASYVGLDAARHPEWGSLETNPKIKLICADSGSTDRHLAEANLIITQSALEHFEEDMFFFQQIADYVKAVKRPLLQFHLMPSAACLTTFPWHGIRQYTPRTVSAITRLFGAETTKRLFFLGSASCNRVHRRYITYPWLRRRADRRQTSNAAYDRELREAVQHDDIAPKRNEACFHALVLQSRTSRDIFLP